MLLGNKRVYDQELIYARVIRLLVSSRDIKFNDVLAYELAAYQPSMFNSEGETKIAKSKSTLKHILQVTVSERTCPIPDTVIYDVSALLWVIPWTTDKLSVYVNNFKMFLSQALQTANVTLVFDRCAAYGKITQSCTSVTECRVKCGTPKQGRVVHHQ